MLLEVLTSRGLDPSALREAAGLGDVDLEDRDARISSEQEEALWAAAMAATGDPALGLLAAERLRDTDYGVLVYLGRHAATVGEALTRVGRWFALVNRGVVLEAVEDHGMVAFRMRVPALPGPLPRPAAEYTLAATLLRMQDATGVDFVPVRVDMPFAAPEDHEAARVFGCPVRYGQRHPQLVFDSGTWRATVPGVDAALSAILAAHASLLADAVPKGDVFVDGVRTRIAEALPDGAPSIDDMGRRLGMSGRTMQRRLKQEGHSFSDLLDEVRLRLARLHLAEGHVSLAETAFLLGFSEQSAFTRAFRRWTGQTPGAWRGRC